MKNELCYELCYACLTVRGYVKQHLWQYAVAHLAWKKNICRGRAAFMSLFSINHIFSRNLRNDQWILQFSPCLET